MAFLASLAGTLRGHLCERGGMIIKTKLQREQGCICTMLRMLELEGKQWSPLKAATGLPEGLFHGLHGYQQILFFSLPERVPAALPLFITFDYSQREEGSHFFGVLFSSYQVMCSNLWADVSLQHALISRQLWEQKGRWLAGLGTLSPTLLWAGQFQGCEPEEPAKQRSPQKQTAPRIHLAGLSPAHQSLNGNKVLPKYKG